MYLGLNQFDHTVYEGISTTQGRGVWPQPFVTQAGLFETYPTANDVAQSAFPLDFKSLFREDFFDPVTRIRRGRFYQASTQYPKPYEWMSEPHPTLTHIQVSSDGRFRCSLITFEASKIRRPNKETNYRFASLGDREAYSVWKIIAVERIHTGEFLVTLKSASTADLIPDIDPDKMESADYLKLSQLLEKVAETANRAGPESVIDRSRDVAAALLAWKSETLNEHKSGDDLGLSLDKTEEYLRQESPGIFHCGHTIRILHARGKPSVQEKLKTPPITEVDGTLAITSLASMIRDLGLSKVRT